MKAFFFQVLVIISLAASAAAETREIKSMREILPTINQQTLVVFDLDNTVMEPAQTLGSDQWFKANVKRDVDGGMAQDAATDQNIPKFLAVHQVTKVLPTEVSTPALIRMLQQKGVHVMALTARPVALAQRTFDELASIGVDFTAQPIYEKNTYIGTSKTEAYIRGVALVSPHGDKGAALATFLKQINKTPRNVVFVDDSQKNVASVEAAFAGYPFSHVSFRYGYDDEKVAHFSNAIGDLEWKYFLSRHVLIDDVTAKTLLSAPNP